MPKLSKSTSDHNIESVPFFSVIAWSIFILFSLFVFLLTRQLKETTVALESQAWEQAGFLAEAIATSTNPE